MKINEFSVDLVTKALSLRLQRHSTIAANIANVDTPGYRARAVSFEESLQSAQRTTDAERVFQVQGRTEVADDRIARLDGNTVSLDRQMGALTENALVYNASAELLARKLKMIKSVIG